MTCLCCVNCEWTLARLAPTWSIRSEWNILEPMNFPETRLYTHKCSTFQCAQRYLEKRRNYVRRTSHIAHHIYIRLVVVPGLRIRQRQFYLCWMLFDEFLFIFFPMFRCVVSFLVFRQWALRLTLCLSLAFSFVCLKCIAIALAFGFGFGYSGGGPNSLSLLFYIWLENVKTQ